MPGANVNFANFSNAAPQLTDYAVGYSSPVSGGERRSLYSDVRGLMQSNLGTAAYQPSTAFDGAGAAANAVANVTKASLGLGLVENTALSTWAGSGNLTTVGNVATGNYKASPIADLYLANAATWNAKQAPGNYITALTGDGSASGPGSAALTLAASGVTAGFYTSANVTVDAKGRVTLIANGTGGGGGGITALTGDVTASGTGSVAATLASGNAAVLNSGTLLAARMPAHTGDVTSTAGSVALTLAAGNAGNLNSGTLLAARMPALTGDVTSTVGTVATTLASTAVTPGTYAYANITVDSKGRLTAAATGVPSGSGTVTSVSVVTANGVSATVATPTSTPALTFTLTDITPNTVATANGVRPAVNGGAALGTTLFQWSNIFMAAAAAVDFANGNVRLVQSPNAITLNPGQLFLNVVSNTANAAVTTSGAQSLTNKKLGSLTTNGFVKTSAGDGTLSVDSNTFINTVGTGMPVVLQVAASDTTSNVTAGFSKVTFRMPYAMTVSNVRASLSTAPTGANVIVGIRNSNTTIFSTNVSIPTTTRTSVGGIPPVVSSPSLADDSEMTIDIVQAGSTIPGVGLVVSLLGTRT